MDVMKAIKERRSIRVFKDIPVDEGKLERILEAARWAPSACNEQAWEFVVVRESSMKQRLVQEAGAVPFTRKCPVLVYVLYREDITAENQANVQSAAAAVQNMLLASHSMGLGSVWICTCGNREKVKALLNVPQNLKVVCAVAIGHPGEVPKPPKRRVPEEVIHNGRYRSGSKGMGLLPQNWDLDSLEKQRERGIRAKSPTPDSFPPKFRKEFSAETARFAEAARESKSALDMLSFSGTHLMEIIRKAGLKRVKVYETSHQISDFIESKRKGMGVRCDIGFGISGLDRIPFKSGSFDLVMCIKKLEMMQDPEKTIKEMGRVLKRGGRLLLSFLNTGSVYGLNYYIKNTMMGSTKMQSNEGPIRPLRIGHVRNLLMKSGFRVEETQGINLMTGGLESFATRSFLKGLCRTIVMDCVKE